GKHSGCFGNGRRLGLMGIDMQDLCLHHELSVPQGRSCYQVWQHTVALSSWSRQFTCMHRTARQSCYTESRRRRHGRSVLHGGKGGQMRSQATLDWKIPEIDEAQWQELVRSEHSALKTDA